MRMILALLHAWLVPVVSSTRLIQLHKRRQWTVLSVRGGGGGGTDMDANQLVDQAANWCNNLGAPAALVAGAVVATVYENMHTGDLDVQPGDGKLLHLSKKLTKLLLLSAFALETISIFVTTVTSTILMSRSLTTMNFQAETALGFLRDNFEFEYLTARICFLQGLVNWLAAIGLAHAIPTGENAETRQINKFVAALLLSTILLMLSFYNHHLTFYSSYAQMLVTWMHVSAHQFLWKGPMAMLFVPSLLVTLYTGYQALILD